VSPGASEGFSLDALEDVHFVTRDLGAEARPTPARLLQTHFTG
jgi:hypothetical protein